MAIAWSALDEGEQVGMPMPTARAEVA